MNELKAKTMNWFWYAIGAALLYGLHQIFTRMAADKIGDGLGGFVVEATAAATILAYLATLYFSGHWNQELHEFRYRLLRAHGNLRGGRHGVLLYFVSNGRSAVCSSDDPRRRRRIDGGRGNLLFPRDCVLPAYSGHRAFDRWPFLTATIAYAA